MKVLQINIYYNEGSTGKIVADIHQRLLRDGHESYVVFGRGKDWHIQDPEHLYRTTPGKRSEVYRKISRITGLRYNTAYIETIKLLKYIDRIAPDIVHLHCLNCAYINPYILLKHLGKKDYKVLVTHHADVTITANCDHAFKCEKWKTGCGKCSTNLTERRSFLIDATHRSWIQMEKAFAKVKNLYASGVSDWMSNRVRQSPFFKDKECKTILNGLDTVAFTYRESTQDIKNKLGIKDTDKVALHVTPNFSAPIKGGKYVIEIAKHIPQVKFIIVGLKKHEVKDLPDNIIPVAQIQSKEELSQYYSLASVTLLPSFRESFSMVTAESLCCGTPVVGFKAGAPETITLPEYSCFVDYGDIDKLQSATNIFLNKGINKTEVSEKARSKYNAEKMYNEYIEYYKDILR